MISTASSVSLIGIITDARPKQVIVASRSSEWDPNRNKLLMLDFLGSEPLIVRLQAFDESEQQQLFDHLHPAESSRDFKNTVTEFGIHALLGNPQMLRIIALALAANDGVLHSRGQLFSDAFTKNVPRA
ncbi:MAG: hypothetical protein ABJ205_04520 [Erythrobacter sp.]|uniref:hypothetical protein n=1 Tax=Erythrobacter sp. TaxID=1042 RepID=UPI003267CA54